MKSPGSVALIPCGLCVHVGIKPAPSLSSPDRGAGFHQDGTESDQSPGGQPIGESGVHGAAEAPAHRSGTQEGAQVTLEVGPGFPCS